MALIKSVRGFTPEIADGVWILSWLDFPNARHIDWQKNYEDPPSEFFDPYIYNWC